jgi:hypothetical protein
MQGGENRAHPKVRKVFADEAVVLKYRKDKPIFGLNNYGI